MLPDLAFVQEARTCEVDAIQGGRQRNEFSIYPFGSAGEAASDANDLPVALEPMDDIVESEERVAILASYLPYARKAFHDRGLLYPFQESVDARTLSVVPGLEALAQRCAELSAMPRLGGKTAKSFELRAIGGLHKLLGGWGTAVGSPRRNRMGPKRAVQEFRRHLVAEAGHEHVAYRRSGDFGADAFWILGRTWGGPIVVLQAKNTELSADSLPGEFLRLSDILLAWFGRRIDHQRSVIAVFAVNTVLTIEMKERVFEAAGSSRGYHLIDAVDILHAESFPQDHLTKSADLRIM